jgi:outer membrane lipoprotein-sorting protein
MIFFPPGASSRLAKVGALFMPLLLAGCSLFPTTRKLPIPKPPLIERTISPENLVQQLNRRWEAINTLTAKVEFRASVSKSAEGVATDYPSVEGHILMRKPESLRVVGQLIGVKVFDMASNGNCFTLLIPHYDKAIKGCGPAKVKSKNTWENLRPGFFFDAMLVRGMASDDAYYVTSDSITVEDAARKHLFTVPEYKLYIVHRMPNSQQLKPLRVVYFHRDDLEPYQQDIYDADGNLETQVLYEAYQDFEGGKFPSVVTIKRPIDDIQIVLSIERVTENQALPDDQFVVPIPEGDKIVTQQ